MCECGDGSDPEVWTGHPYNLDTAPGGGGCKSKVQVNVMKTDSVIYVLHRKERDGNCQNGTFQVTAQGMGVGNLNGSDAIDGKRKVPWALHSSEGWLGLSSGRAGEEFKQSLGGSLDLDPSSGRLEEQTVSYQVCTEGMPDRQDKYEADITLMSPTQLGNSVPLGNGTLLRVKLTLSTHIDPSRSPVEALRTHVRLIRFKKLKLNNIIGL
jgi:hypothetical protein